jgi:hypothetical protein
VSLLKHQIRHASLIALSFCVFTTSHAQDFLRTSLPSTHPLIGQWRIELPQFNCFEEYDVRTNGTRSVVTNQQQAESEFMIFLAPQCKRLLQVDGQDHER